jgi:hypothetical protein
MKNKIGNYKSRFRLAESTDSVEGRRINRYKRFAWFCFVLTEILIAFILIMSLAGYRFPILF